jgi:hypothetical protein
MFFPPFPPKTFSKPDPKDIEERISSFNQILSVIAKSDNVLNSSTVRAFLGDKKFEK